MLGSREPMKNEELFQQMAFLRFLTSQTDENRNNLAMLTGLRVGRELMNRITGQDKIDAYKKDCVLSITSFLQQNPGASQADISAEVQKNVLVFVARVKALETAPLF